MNDVDLCVWVVDAQPGDQIVYYTGHLSRDRLPHSEGYSEAIRRKIGELGNSAWMLGEEYWVHLVQRRVSTGCWDYIAVRRAETPKLKPRLPHHPVACREWWQGKAGPVRRADRDGQCWRPARRDEDRRSISLQCTTSIHPTHRPDKSAPHRRIIAGCSPPF